MLYTRRCFFGGDCGKISNGIKKEKRGKKRERERKAQRDGYPANEEGDLNPTVVNSLGSSREESFLFTLHLK